MGCDRVGHLAHQRRTGPLVLPLRWAAAAGAEEGGFLGLEEFTCVHMKKGKSAGFNTHT